MWTIAVMQHRDVHSPLDALYLMHHPDGYAFRFVPNEEYPADTAPRELDGWRFHRWDDGSVTYVHTELERQAIARMAGPTSFVGYKY